MRIGLPLPYAGNPVDSIGQLSDFTGAGAGIVYVAETYSFDAVSQLGFIAARLPGIEIASNILPIYTRTPSLLAMTAASLDQLSGGRFTLGIGASGPQVIEGFHGVRYEAPVARTRDVIDICRQVWRREKLSHDSRFHQIPLNPDRGGSGLGKPIKLVNTPVREQIPILIAAMGPRNVALAAELAQAWSPFFFRAEGTEEVWGQALREGYARRDPGLGPMDISVPMAVAIGDDVEDRLDWVRPMYALYIGGMGARGKNFYYDLATRFGYGSQASTIQELFLSGRKDEAAAAVPAELIRSISLIGPRGWVAERIAALAGAGVTTISATPLAHTHQQRVAVIETLHELAS